MVLVHLAVIADRGVEHPLKKGRESGGLGGGERIGQRRERCRHLSGAGGERFVTRPGFRGASVA